MPDFDELAERLSADKVREINQQTAASTMDSAAARVLASGPAGSPR